MLPGSSFAEEGVERVVASSDRLVARHLAIRLNAMLQTVQFPAGITDLDTSLANMDGAYDSRWGITGRDGCYGDG